MKTHFNHEYFMNKALRQARRAWSKAEVPVGAVLVRENKIIARAHNLRETKQSPCAHAEVLVIEKAARKLSAWRLENCTLYVSLEPCLMCWGSIIQARIPLLVFAASDAKAGVCGSVLSLHEKMIFNHLPQVISGIKAEEASALLSDFFSQLRQRKRAQK